MPLLVQLEITEELQCKYLKENEKTTLSKFKRQQCNRQPKLLGNRKTIYQW